MPGVDDLEMPEGSIGQRPTGTPHQVQHSIIGHDGEVYQEVARFGPS